MEYYSLKNVGELRKILEGLPDEMPLHSVGNGGNIPHVVELAQCKLRKAKKEDDYFAHTEDPVWKKTNFSGFDKTEIDALVFLR